MALEPRHAEEACVRLWLVMSCMQVAFQYCDNNEDFPQDGM